MYVDSINMSLVLAYNDYVDVIEIVHISYGKMVFILSNVIGICISGSMFKVYMFMK